MTQSAIQTRQKRGVIVPATVQSQAIQVTEKFEETVLASYIHRILGLSMCSVCSSVLLRRISLFVF
jgi:hypothetical protein